MPKFDKVVKQREQKRRNEDNLLLLDAQEKKSKGYYSQFEKYQNDPLLYSREILDTYLWKKQREIIENVLLHERVSIRASTGVGKTHVCATLINWFYDAFPVGMGLATAGSFMQLKDVTMGTVRRLRKTRNDFRGEHLPILYENESHHFSGLSTSNAQNFAGRHLPNTMIVVDEATSVAQETFDVFEGVFDGENRYFIAIFNPVDTGSAIYTIEQQPGWYTLSISALDFPNIQAGVHNLKNGLPANATIPIPGGITLERFETQLIAWSEEITENDYRNDIDVILPSTSFTDNPRFFRPGPNAESRLLGRWPTQVNSTIISKFLVEQAKKTLLKPNESPFIMFGLDVGRTNDPSALCIRLDNTIKDIIEIRSRGTDLVNKVLYHMKQLSEEYNIPLNETPLAIDTIGVGGPIYDLFNSLDDDLELLDVNVSSSALNKLAYGNLKAELWYEFQEKLLRKEISFANLSDEIYKELQKELTMPLRVYDRFGKQMVESKEQIIKRLGRSPDLADALILTEAITNDYNSITIDVG